MTDAKHCATAGSGIAAVVTLVGVMTAHPSRPDPGDLARTNTRMELNSAMQAKNRLEPKSRIARSASGATPAIAKVAPSAPRKAGTDAMSTNLVPALQRNRRFAAAGGHEGAVVFPNLRLFVITCLDPRVDPTHFLGLELGDAVVVRNVGGRVTPEVINDVAFIGHIAETVPPDGPLFEVAVIHHTQCGSGALADRTFRRRYAQRIGADETTLREHAILDPAATVARDVERLRSARAVPARVSVSGHVYDVVTGLVQTIVPAGRPADQSIEQPKPAQGDQAP